MYLRHPSPQAALDCFVTTAVSAGAVADSSARASAPRDPPTRNHAAADHVPQAHTRLHATTGFATQRATLRGASDAATQARMPGRAQAGGIFTTKLRALAPLPAGIERASRTNPADGRPSLAAARMPTALRGRFEAVDRRHGGKCDHALGLAGCA